MEQTSTKSVSTNQVLFQYLHFMTLIRRPTTVSADSSSFGLGAVPIQKLSNSL